MEYPEHEKLKAIRDKSQACGDFIEWLREEKSMFLCIPGIERFETGEWRDDPSGQRYRGVTTPISRLLAEFFEIDEKRLEEEKRAMLATLRAENEILAARQGDDDNE